MKKVVLKTQQEPWGSYDPTQLRLPSFVAARKAFEAGNDNPRAFLENCLDTIAARDGAIKAFVCFNASGARHAADAATMRYHQGRPLSPIDGCVIAVKDSIETIDMPTEMNSLLFKGWMSGRDAACIYALRRSGAVILGKTFTPELVLGTPGPTRNPFNLNRTPGGSSSGSAAAVGAGMVPVAIGNQTGGSLIRPASYCANYGFKPSHGALNVGGMHPIAPSQDHIGPMASTLADAWLTAQQISYVAGGTGGHPGLTGGPDLPAPVRPKRLARLKTRGWEELDQGTVAAFEEFVTGLTAAGVNVLDETSSTSIKELEGMLKEANDVAYDIIMYEARWPTLAYGNGRPHEVLSEYLRKRLARGIEMTPDEYRRALERRNVIKLQVADVAAQVDGFITLASSGPAPSGLEDTGSRYFLSPWSMVGGPSYSLPLLALNGLPIGVQLMGMNGTDERTTAIAHWIDIECSA
jgi:Asp-tRNA(Asn)/Glu-tRNA(Gln) amidotransferase A subunit family amidase